VLEEQLLDPRHHNRKTFRCGVPVLDRFLAQPGRTEPPPGLRGNVRVGGYALLVDAKDEPAAQFYEHHGFRRLQDAPISLYLPLGPQGDRRGGIVSR